MFAIDKIKLTSDATPIYPLITFDVEITILQPPLVIDGGCMTYLTTVSNDDALSFVLDSEERANTVHIH